MTNIKTVFTVKHKYVKTCLNGDRILMMIIVDPDGSYRNVCVRFKYHTNEIEAITIDTDHYTNRELSFVASQLWYLNTVAMYFELLQQLRQ